MALTTAAHKVLQSLQASLPHMVILFYERCLGTVMLVDVYVCVRVWRLLRNIRSQNSTVHVALMVLREGTCLGHRLSNHHWPWLAKCFSSCGSADLFYLRRNKSQRLIRLHVFVSVRLCNCGWLAQAVSHLWMFCASRLGWASTVLISTHGCVVTLKYSPFPVAPTINPQDSRHANWGHVPPLTLF